MATGNVSRCDIFHRGEAVPFMTGAVASTAMDRFSRGEAFPAMIEAGGTAQSAVATPATATWAVAGAVLTAALTLVAAPATATWAAVTPSVSGTLTITATPATATWSAPAATLTPGALVFSVSPAAGIWRAPGAGILGGDLILPPLGEYTGTLIGGESDRLVGDYSDFLLKVTRGSDKAFRFTVYDRLTGLPADISAFQKFYFTAKRSLSDADADAVIRLTSADNEGLTVVGPGIGLVGGVVPGAATVALPARRLWLFADAEARDGDGVVKPIMAGRVLIVSDVSQDDP